MSLPVLKRTARCAEARCVPALSRLARVVVSLVVPAAAGVSVAALPGSPSAGATTPPPPNPLASSIKSSLGRGDCMGWSGYDTPRFYGGSPGFDLINAVMHDEFKAPAEPLRTVGDGHGNINWNQPKITESGRIWLNSLKWVGGLLTIERDGASKYPRSHPYHDFTVAEKQAQLRHALAIAQDWIKDHPKWEATDPRSTDRGPVTAAGQRLQVLSCLRMAAGRFRWLDQAIARHVTFLIGKSAAAKDDYATYLNKAWKPAQPAHYWNGENNIGLDQNLGLFSAACTFGRRDWYAVAVRRIGRHAAKVYDAQGVDNEQAVGYSAFNYMLWTKTVKELKSCGGSGAAAPVVDRLTRAADFVAMAHRPDGNIEQLGDTEAKPQPIWGTTAEYAATQGASGPKPSQRVAVYDSPTNGGYVFGHSGWGEDRPFSQETFYSIRFGRGLTLHGHNDHTSVTFFARGQEILTDAGQPGYAKNAYRTYIVSPQAHNVVTATAPFDLHAATRLTQHAHAAAGDTYTMSDTAYAGVTRQRSILAVYQPNPIVMLVADTLTSKTKHRYDQLWHLGPELVARAAGGRATASSGNTTVTVLPIALGSARPALTVVRGQNTPTIQGWTSAHILTKTPDSAVTVSQTGTSVTLLTAIVPASVGAQVDASATPSPAGGWDVTLAIGDQTVRAHLDRTGHLSR